MDDRAHEDRNTDNNVITADEWAGAVIPELEAARGTRRNHSWSEQDIQLLRRYYQEVDVRTIAKHLSRSVSSVRQAAERYGVRAS